MEYVDLTEQIKDDLHKEGFEGDFDAEVAKRKAEIPKSVKALKAEGRKAEPFKGSSEDYMKMLTGGY